MNIPTSTYRIQFNKEFTFSDLENIIDYLEELGISTIYASPIFKATPGSMHGYDVTDPNLINPEIGTYEQFVSLRQKLKIKNISWLQDIVPNHMAFSLENYRLFDVFERGHLSSYSNYFDIDWDHPGEMLSGKIMIPTLGNDLDDCIINNNIVLKYISGKGLFFSCYEKNYPLNPLSYNSVLDNFSIEVDLPAVHLHSSYKEWMDNKTALIELIDAFVNEEEIQSLNEDKAFLRTLLEEQHYHFCKWNITDHTINYRRFFTVSDLICLRQEDENVFAEYHQFIKQLYDDDLIEGVRIDHIDGLNDPTEYIERLRNLLGDDCYIICEKILEQKEHLPNNWKLQGTSGYEFLSYVNQVLTDTRGADKIVSFYKENISSEPYKEMVFQKKHSFLYKYMQGELDNAFRLLEHSQLLPSVTSKHKDALGVFMAAFPVYRIYLTEFPVQSEAHFIHEAYETAVAKRADLKKELTELKELFFAENQDALPFLKRLMQFTGPLAAKGVEDTTFYTYNPLISHNEVGDAPEEMGISVHRFHEQMIQRQKQNPLSLNNTSTHDTKRGEDARMRINALSLFPEKWMQKVNEWKQIAASFKTSVDNTAAPTKYDEYFIYQAIVGGIQRDLNICSECTERLKAYTQKAFREAKMNTNWNEPNTEYEKACNRFIDQLFQTESFIYSLKDLLHTIVPMADNFSLIQVLIKATAPGIPDFYQGTELWDLSYVDPDNRRKVDYEKRKAILQHCKTLEHDWSELHNYLSQNITSAAMKFWVTKQLIQLRKNFAVVFNQGEYIPFSLGRNAIGFARKKENDWVVVAASLTEEVQNVIIDLPSDAPSSWKNIFTQADVSLTANSISFEPLSGNLPIICLRSL
jgi:(1->4)-alpha-D-glucan 1-alpha-D-glucosylmutase